MTRKKEMDKGQQKGLKMAWRYTRNFQSISQVFPGGSDSKESFHSVGDLGSVPGLGRSPEEGMATHPVFLPGTYPWTEEPGMLQWGRKELGMTERLSRVRDLYLKQSTTGRKAQNKSSKASAKHIIKIKWCCHENK